MTGSPPTAKRWALLDFVRPDEDRIVWIEGVASNSFPVPRSVDRCGGLGRGGVGQGTP